MQPILNLSHAQPHRRLLGFGLSVQASLQYWKRGC